MMWMKIELFDHGYHIPSSSHTSFSRMEIRSIVNLVRFFREKGMKNITKENFLNGTAILLNWTKEEGLLPIEKIKVSYAEEEQEKLNFYSLSDLSLFLFVHQYHEKPQSNTINRLINESWPVDNNNSHSESINYHGKNHHDSFSSDYNHEHSTRSTSSSSSSSTFELNDRHQSISPDHEQKLPLTPPRYGSTSSKISASNFENTSPTNSSRLASSTGNSPRSPNSASILTSPRLVLTEGDVHRSEDEKKLDFIKKHIKNMIELVKFSTDDDFEDLIDSAFELPSALESKVGDDDYHTAEHKFHDDDISDEYNNVSKDNLLHAQKKNLISHSAVSALGFIFEFDIESLSSKPGSIKNKKMSLFEFISLSKVLDIIHLETGALPSKEYIRQADFTKWLMDHLNLNREMYPIKPFPIANSNYYTITEVMPGANSTVFEASDGDLRIKPIIISNVTASTLYYDNMIVPSSALDPISSSTSPSSLPDLYVSHCNDATVYMLQPCRFIYIIGCMNCTIILAPNTHITTIDMCINMKVTSTCHQIRVVNTVDSEIQTFTLNPPIVLGDCRTITFGPCNVNYSTLRREVKEYLLDPNLRIKSNINSKKYQLNDTNDWWKLNEFSNVIDQHGLPLIDTMNNPSTTSTLSIRKNNSNHKVTMQSLEKFHILCIPTTKEKQFYARNNSYSNSDSTSSSKDMNKHALFTHGLALSPLYQTKLSKITRDMEKIKSLMASSDKEFNKTDSFIRDSIQEMFHEWLCKEGHLSKMNHLQAMAKVGGNDKIIIGDGCGV